MNNATNQIGVSAYVDAGKPAETKPLESLAHAVQRINTAQVQVSRFLDRWHGPQPEPALAPGETGAANQLVQPHGVTLNQLFAAIDRLETRIEALNQIG